MLGRVLAGAIEEEMKAALAKEMTSDEQVTPLIEWEKWLDENNITMTYNFKYNKLKYIIHFNLSKQ